MRQDRITGKLTTACLQGRSKLGPTSSCHGSVFQTREHSVVLDKFASASSDKKRLQTRTMVQNFREELAAKKRALKPKTEAYKEEDVVYLPFDAPHDVPRHLGQESLKTALDPITRRSLFDRKTFHFKTQSEKVQAHELSATLRVELIFLGIALICRTLIAMC